MALIRCPQCKLRSSSRSPRCYHCNAELEPHRLASLVLMFGLAAGMVLLAAAVISGLGPIARLVFALQEIDEVERVWRVGIGLAAMLLIAVILRLLLREDRSASVVPPVNVTTADRQREPARR